MENILGIVAALGIVCILMAVAIVMLRHSHKWLSKVIPKTESDLQLTSMTPLPGGQQAIILRYHQLEWLVILGKSHIEIAPISNPSMGKI